MLINRSHGCKLYQWRQTREVSTDWSYFWQVPSLYAIIISIGTSAAIAAFFKYRVKPKIEVIFEQNLENQLYYVFNSVEEIDRIFDLIKTITDKGQTHEIKTQIEIQKKQCTAIYERISMDQTKQIYFNSMFFQQIQFYIWATMDYIEYTDHHYRELMGDRELMDCKESCIKRRQRHAKEIIKYCKTNKLPTKFQSYKLFLERWKAETGL